MLYGAIKLEGVTYRVKTTIKRKKDTNKNSKASNCDAQKIEVSSGTLGSAEWSRPPHDYTSIPAESVDAESHDKGPTQNEFPSAQLSDLDSERTIREVVRNVNTKNVSKARNMMRDSAEKTVLKEHDALNPPVYHRGVSAESLERAKALASSALEALQLSLKNFALSSGGIGSIKSPDSLSKHIKPASVLSAATPRVSLIQNIFTDNVAPAAGGVNNISRGGQPALLRNQRFRLERGGERENGEYFYDLDATDIEDVDKNMEVSETLKLARIPNSGSQEDTPNKGRIHMVKRFVNDMDALPSQYGARESAEKTALKEHDALNQGGVSSEPLVRAKD